MSNKDKIIVISVISFVFLVLFLILNPFVLVGAGERAVLLNWGAVQDKIMAEGLHFRVPIMQKVKVLDVKTQKEEVEASAASKDLQDVSTKIALNYHLQEDKVNSLWQKIGKDYKIRIIDPAIQEAVKAITAKYTAEELITKREMVKEETKKVLKERLVNEFIVVDEFSIVNFNFSEEFNKAIEAKQTAVQQALKAENDLRRIKTEAEQRVAQAEAEARAIKLQSEAANNEKYVNLKALEVQMEAVKKWSGNLPQYMVPGAVLPFIGNLSK